MIIFVPDGNDEDITRKSEFYDPIFNYMREIGLPNIWETTQQNTTPYKANPHHPLHHVSLCFFFDPLYRLSKHDFILSQRLEPLTLPKINSIKPRNKYPKKSTTNGFISDLSQTANTVLSDLNRFL